MDFATRFDSYFAAIQSQNSYLEAKGYRAEGDRTLWKPQYEADLEPETTVGYGPGAASVGELLDDVYLQLVAGFAPWMNLSGSLYMLESPSTHAKVTPVFLVERELEQ